MARRRRLVDNYQGAASKPHKHRGHFKSSGIAKRCYTPEQAQELAAKISADPRRVGTVSAYECPEPTCVSWHIGGDR